MQRRYVVSAVIVIFVARMYWKPERSLPQDHTGLPQRLQAFLLAYDLTHTFDADMAVLSANGTRPGQLLSSSLAKRHPVVMVPGITSCGLEVWRALPCLGEGFFRRRIWGDYSMAEAILKNWACWLDHIALDPVSGVDREGVRVRSARGLHSADYFIGGFHLWAKVLQNLADIGYNEEDLLLECYDWRLAFPMLETRDGKLTEMRVNIERVVLRAGEKAVVLAHSMGANLWIYFMGWVEQVSPGWVDKHIAVFVNIAGSILGSMDPLAAFLSGEMAATTTLGPVSGMIESMAMTWEQARDVYWSFGGLGALLPMGGSAIWGSSSSGWTDSPVDIIDFYHPTMAHIGPKTLEELYTTIDSDSQVPLHSYVAWTAYDRGLHRPIPGETEDPRRFSNPLASALPKAPNLRVFCLYGTGIPTPRSYRYSYKQVRWSFADHTMLPETRSLHWSSAMSLDDVRKDLRRYLGTKDAVRPVRMDLPGNASSAGSVAEAIKWLTKQLDSKALQHPEKWIRINSSFQSEAGTAGPWDNGLDGVFTNGVANTDGDGTVPLVSLGYMCGHGWRDFPELNPANVTVRTKEYKHMPCSVMADSRGGHMTSKHVDIIGNSELIADILQIAAGSAAHLEEDSFVSNMSAIGKVISERLRQASW